MVNIALIGATGVIARRRHLQGIVQSKSANLYGVYGRNKEKLAAIATEYQTKAFRSLEDIWQDPQVDAVLVCTPTPSHCEIVVAALNAGKHVLCEKAMAVSTEEAKRMAAAVRSSGKKLMMLHVQRRYAPHLEAKKLLDQGEIGRLISYRTNLGVAGVPGAATAVIPEWKNVVAEIGSHRIDLMRYIVNSEVTRVFSYIDCLYPEKHGTLADNTTILMRHENGVMGTLCFSRTSYNADDRSTVLFGTEGVITTFAETHELLVEKRDGTRIAYSFPNAHAQNDLELTDLHQIFCECIEKDTEMPISEQDGVASMCIIDAINESNTKGAWVEVGSID